MRRALEEMPISAPDPARLGPDERQSGAAPEGAAGARGWETTFGLSQVIFGRDALERLGALTRELGGKRALLVTDRGVRGVGHVARAKAVLDEASIATAVYDGVEENPTTRHVADGVAIAREFGADCLIGFGGGSSLDCAKGINFLLSNGGRMEDYWGTGKATREMLPSVGVPTTAGTGSEAQSYALICQADSGTKMACGDKKVIFRAVVLDPTLVASVPRSVAGATGIDAISHAVESYVSTRGNPISRLFAREAWRRLEAGFRRVVSAAPDRDELDGCDEMLVGSYLAGAAIEHSMLGAAHACANPLTARFPIAHGVAVGLLLPHVVRYNSTQVGGLYDELRGLEGPTHDSRPLDQWIVELKSLAGLPESLGSCGVPRSSLPDLALEAEGQWTAKFNPRPVTRKELLEIYESAF